MTTLSKTIAILIVAGIFASPAIAQQFQRAIGTTDEERSEWIASTTDGGSVICGIQNDANNGNAYVVKLDSAGATQWDTILFSSGFDVPNRVVQTSDGGYALAGETNSCPGGFGISLIRLDASGNFMWSACYDGTAFVGGNFGTTGLEETDDLGFILCGRKQQTDQADQVGILIKTDINGDLEWQRNYSDTRFETSGFTSFADVHQTAQQGYIVTGFTADSVTDSRDAILMETDASGNVLWFKTYGQDNFSEGGFNCAIAQNGDYLVTGFSKAIGEGGGTFFMRTDSVGNLIVFQNYRFFNGGHGMLETPTGSVIIAGNALDFATFEDASLLHVDGFGNVIWCMAYGDGGTGQEFGESVALMPGGGFQLAAWTNVFGSGNFDIYTVRTDSSGISTCNEQAHQPVATPDQPPVTEVEIEVREISEFTFFQYDSTSPGFNNINLCDDDVVDGCVEPPHGMVAWYPLDAAEPDLLVHELAFNNQGEPFNGTAVSGGMVNESAIFDGVNDFYEAPDAPQINFGTGDFSMDAWVRTTDTSGVSVLLDKRVEADSVTGYSLFTFNGDLSFQLADGGFTNYISSAFIADDEWHLIAVTIDRDNVGIFYVDGVPVDTFNPIGRTGSLTNPGVLRLGARSSSNTGNWAGRLDEVELFDRVLTDEEIVGIFEAGPNGKCRDTCHTQWDVPFCAGDDSVIAAVTICNNGTVPSTYSLELNGLLASECPGNINGPTSFTILDTVPVTVNPGECATVNVSIDRPADMNSALDLGCFEAVWTNLSNGFTSACLGSVIDRRFYCGIFADPDIDIAVVVGEPIFLPITILDQLGNGGPIDFQIIAMPSNPDVTSVASLDGLPPGTPIFGSVILPPQGEVEIEVEARLLDHEPFVFFDIILMIADDDGNFSPSDSVAFRTLAPEVGCDGLLGDVNGDGAINLLDVQPFVDALSSGEFICEADLNQDGFVNLLDVQPFVDLLSGG